MTGVASTGLDDPEGGSALALLRVAGRRRLLGFACGL